MTAPAVSFHEEEALGKAYDSRLMRRLLAFAAPYRALVAIALFFLMIEGALQLVGPFLTQHVIDVAIPAHDYAAVKLAALLYGLSLLVEFGTTYGQTWFTALLGQNVMRDLRLQLFSHLQRLPIAFFDRNPAGRLITRVTSDVETLNELFTAGVVSGMGDLFTLLAISVAMLVTDWRLSLATFAVIPLVVLVSHLFRVNVREAYREIRTRLARINAFLQERLSGMRIVQLFGRERDEARRFDELNRAHLDANLRSITVYALYFPAIEILTSVALATLIVAGAARVEATTLTVGTVAAFLQLVRRFFQPLQDLSDKYNTLQTAMASSERIFHLLDTEPGADAKPDTAEQYKRPRAVTVEFKNVWFAYDRPHSAASRVGSEPEWVLRDVSFAARPGQTLAIVGHTGAGKTTIVSLLMRFYDPQRGQILVNGRDIREMPIEQLRELIGYVQQDIFLFAGDVASNIRLSAPLTDVEVEAAASQVGADRIIRRLAHGYRQVLGERGASISVGERQLLSFARAVAADPALLILDEATSAVDSEVEAEIQQALRVLLAGRTTIAIAHRLSTIVEADDIIVMHHGEVVEHGTHEALLALDGLYARLWRLQI
ncbi:MAG TPA: ABC transporter ATP-binding protein [Gemmatimonadaceae bacterium]